MIKMRLITIILFALSSMVYGAENGLRLVLKHTKDWQFVVVFENVTDKPLWFMYPGKGSSGKTALSFYIQDSCGALLRFQKLALDDESVNTSIEKRTRRLNWTELEPRQSVEYAVNLHDGTWYWPSDFSMDSTYTFYAEYNFPKSSTSYGWRGHVQSNPVKVKTNLDELVPYLIHSL